MPKTPLDFTDSPHLRFRHGATRGWVQIGTVIAAVSYAVMGAANVASWGWQPERHPGSLFVVALVAGAGWLVASRGNVLVGGLMALGACWCEVQYSLLVSDWFPVPSLIAGPAVLVAAALLLRTPVVAGDHDRDHRHDLAGRAGLPGGAGVGRHDHHRVLADYALGGDARPRGRWWGWDSALRTGRSTRWW